MANNYECVTLLNDIPSEHFKPSHERLLNLVGFECESDGESVYLYSPDERGTSELEVDIPDSGSLVDGESALDGAWRMMLEENGATDYAQEAFVLALRGRLSDGAGQSLDWAEVMQEVLRDLPLSVPALDFKGAYWCDKARPGAFGGFAVRVTRTAILVQENADKWFRKLDAEQRHDAGLRELCGRAGIELDYEKGQGTDAGRWTWGDEHGAGCGGFESERDAASNALESKFGEAWRHDAKEGNTRRSFLDYVGSELEQAEHELGGPVP